MVNLVKHCKSRGFSTTIDSWLVNLSKTGRSSKQAVSIAVDIFLVIFSLWCAYSLRLSVFFTDISATWHFFVLLPPLTILVMGSLGIYRWMIRSSNRRLFYQLGKACCISAMILALTAFLLPADRSNPRSLFVIYGLLLTCGTFATRFLWQGLFDSGSRGEPVAIYGAGQSGTSLVQSFDQGDKFRPVVVLDDNPALDGTTLGGVKVCSPGSDGIGEILSELDVGRVILAMPSLSSAEYEKKVELIKKHGVPVQTVPTYTELVSGTGKMNHVRDISITDILGRSEVPANLELLGTCVKGHVVLVTGAGGSIGSELCRQIAKQQPRKLIVVDHSEENLYKLTEELSSVYNHERHKERTLVSVLCSVNDADAIAALMARHEVSTVYHAAAYKHVPIIEAQPEQGVRVNVFGTLTVLDAAILNNVANFVLISTDKAVRPTNSMGATKRIAELILQAKARQQSSTKISMVRFGNVLGSSGSVVPKFKKQIEKGGPITITHPDVTRFFMSIPEASQLVLQASAIAKGGDVFVLDMGAPVRIEDLAISMVKMAGKKLKRETGNDEDIEITVLGLRPGEKMYEELFITDSHQPTVIEKVFTANEQWISWDELKFALDGLSALTKAEDRSQLKLKMMKLAFFGDDVDVAPIFDFIEENQIEESEKLALP